MDESERTGKTERMLTAICMEVILGRPATITCTSEATAQMIVEAVEARVGVAGRVEPSITGTTWKAVIDAREIPAE